MILVFGYSTLLKELVKRARKEKVGISLRQNIRIIFTTEIDNQHSREFVSKLASKGVPITYTALSCVPYFMNQVSKVIVGALTMYSNGSLLGLAGTALVASFSPGRILR